MNKTDLQLVSADELIDEIGSRFDHFVFSGMQVRNKKEDGIGEVFTMRKWKGNNATCLGLCHQLNFIMCDCYFDQEPLDREE